MAKAQVVARNIRAALARQEIRIVDLATAIGMGRMSLSNRLNGRVDFRLSELERITAQIGSSIEALLAENPGDRR